MATEKWTAYSAPTTVLSTELNALANGDYSDASAAFNNSSVRFRYGVFEFVGGTFGVAPTDFTSLSLFMVESADGTNYEDGGGAVRPQGAKFRASVELRAVTTSQRLVSRPFELTPTLVKFVLHNGSGQALPATGSVVKLYTFNREIVA